MLCQLPLFLLIVQILSGILHLGHLVLCEDDEDEDIICLQTDQHTGSSSTSLYIILRLSTTNPCVFLDVIIFPITPGRRPTLLRKSCRNWTKIEDELKFPTFEFYYKHDKGALSNG